MGFVGMFLFADWQALGGGGAFLTPMAVTALFVGMLGFFSHIFNDQMGILGSRLFYPFDRKRANGMGVSSSASIMGNIVCNWLSIAFIIFNINAFSPNPTFRLPWASGLAGDFNNIGYYLLSLLNYSVYYIAVPIAVLFLIKNVYGRLYTPPAIQETDDADEALEGVDSIGEMGTI